MARTAIVWFRRDLRLADNEALNHAVAVAERVSPLFVVPVQGMVGAPDTASATWLDSSLRALDASLRARGSSLTVLAGPAPDAVVSAATAIEATVVTCSRDWTPSGLAEEHAVKQALDVVGVELRVHEGQLLLTPGKIVTGSGTPYSVFTPFSRAWSAALDPAAPTPAPSRIPGSDSGGAPAAASVTTPILGGYDHVLGDWTPGEAGAQARLTTFIEDAISDYDSERDIPALPGTSMLSAHLAWGEISPRQVVAAANAACGESAAWPFVRQLAWREFAHHVLHAHPETQREPLRPAFAAFPWRDDPEGTAAWLAGTTGFPIVDAGMRQLAQTGWVHNRVRLIVASFLTKDLLVPWQTGEEAFRERLVDYDPAANAFNWQWVAGSGADAAPYFRVFNPTVQGERFDPSGAYVSRWVPELAALEPRWIHKPHLAPPLSLMEAGVVVDETYPSPILDHAEARIRALAALGSLKGVR